MLALTFASNYHAYDEHVHNAAVGLVFLSQCAVEDEDAASEPERSSDIDSVTSIGGAFTYGLETVRMVRKRVSVYSRSGTSAEKLRRIQDEDGHIKSTTHVQVEGRFRW